MIFGRTRTSSGPRTGVTSPQRPQEEYRWFWPGGTFKGNRVNDRHYTNAEKQADRQKMKDKASSRR